ncbi:Polyprotein [Phytophthora palmivora]|uniref:Polyprotein n=1 Tax=Phytophthora palmivora TaxID=4796 RepID=A0A2P4YC40_9STRA|nr:Polyprotein [Phytophthora palmivora]
MLRYWQSSLKMLSCNTRPKICSVVRAMEAWNTPREYYNRTTLHNRVAMPSRLHEFKTEEGTPIFKHMDAFDELVVRLQTLGEPVDEARFPSECELIASVVENPNNITLTEFKEKLLKEHERLQKKETTEKAFGVDGNDGRFKGDRSNGRKDKIKCFKCDQVGDIKRDCPSRSDGIGNGAVFAVGEGFFSGLLIDSGAISHMTPYHEDMFDFEETVPCIDATIADCKKLRWLV